MIPSGKAARLMLMVLLAAILFSMTTTGALAADGQTGWRPIYDLVMRWVNFIILAFVIIKFSRRPLKAFLSRQKEDIAAEIDRLEQTKAELIGHVEDAGKQLEASTLRFEELKQRIVLRGENKKQEIIDKAHQEAEFLMAGARKRVDNQVLQAKKHLRDELIDTAFDLALEKLPGLITGEDSQKLTRRYLESTLQR